MFEFIRNFLADETGAVTVDWVVLTAAVVGLGFSVVLILANGNVTVADAISNQVATITVDAGQ